MTEVIGHDGDPSELASPARPPVNEHLAELARALEASQGIAFDDLLDALFMLRAHRSLAGIVSCCARLAALLDQFQEIEASPVFEDQDARLEVVRAIAGLKGLDPHFYGARQNRFNETPLRPYTGDSGLCDLLLILEGSGSTSEHAEDFAFLQAWYAWQVFNYQNNLASQDDGRFYRDYLLPQETDLRLNAGEGTRVYGAFRLLRKLGEPTHADIASGLREAIGTIGPESSERLATLLKFAISEREGRRPAAAQMAAFGSPEHYAECADETIRLNDRLLQEEEGHSPLDLGLLRPFLSELWSPDSGRPRRTALQRAISRVNARNKHLQVRRFELGYAKPERLDGDGGIPLICLFPKSKLEDDVDDPPDREVDEDPEEDEVDPGIQLFLGKGGPIEAWVQARSVVHRVESANAMLFWPDWRLSRENIERVLALAAGGEPGSTLADRARLTLGLSLLTGRTLDDLAGFQVVERVDGFSQDLVIDRSLNLLFLPAGTPQLKSQPTACGPSERFILPWEPCLRLPLPESWLATIDRLLGQPVNRTRNVVRACRELLRAPCTGTPSLAEAGVTEKAICSAMPLALLRGYRDDLALVKIVADTNDANLRNIIHYASYPQEEVERRWRGVASAWSQDLALPAPARRGVVVGAPFGIDLDQVKPAIHAVKERFASNTQDGAWDKGSYNNLVIYCALWLALATAGRGTRYPLPPWIDTSGWALVRDKHRPDESTDRYLPLSEKLQRQLRYLRAVGEGNSLLHPRFRDSLASPESGFLILGKDDSLNAFRASSLNLSGALRGLPRNWARRLVRSMAPLRKMPGRMVDAGLGHFVRGRHPWSMTSDFPVQEFRHRWLRMQEILEDELGFEVLVADQHAEVALDSLVRMEADLPPPANASVDPPEPPGLSPEECDRILRTHDPDNEYALVFDNGGEPFGESARSLVAHAVLAKDNPYPPEFLAEALCRHIRERTGVPLFSGRPRTRYARNWTVSERGFAAHATRCPELFQAIEYDLGHLPAQEPDMEVRIGRLLGTLALRGGVLDAKHLDAVMRHLASQAPIEAVGSAWMIQFKAISKRSKLEQTRTLLLEPYLACLLVAEREDVRSRLQELCQPAGYKKRSEAWNACLKAYFRSLDVKPLALGAFLHGLRTRLELATCPLVASYASARIDTNDLSVNEFRRLAGLAVSSQAGAEALPNWLDPPSERQMPDELCTADANLAVHLAGYAGEPISAWVERADRLAQAQTEPRARLLCGFSKFLLARFEAFGKIEEGEGGGDAAPQEDGRGIVSRRFGQHHARNLAIVWEGLSGWTEPSDDGGLIDETTLQNLFELTTDRFPARKHHGAWQAFRAFLIDPDSDKAGFEIRGLSGEMPSAVSAKILSRKELDAIEERLGSVQSGFGSLPSRESARMHFALARWTGARRSEIEMLRWADVDGSMLRIRPYEGHTLKTKASTRIVPKRLVPPPIWKELEEKRGPESVKLIDVAPEASASGDNFFDKVAKVMKDVTGDRDLGLHHLRHTRASMLLLGLVSRSVSLSMEALWKDLPWLKDSLPPNADIKTLVGEDGPLGQGMQAVAKMLGHLHETTTHHHYVHTHCIALYAHCLKATPINIARAFHTRLSGGSALYPEVREIKDETGMAAALERGYRWRNLIEKIVNRRNRKKGITAKAIHRDETPLTPPTALNLTTDRLAQARAKLLRLEALQSYLEEGGGDKPPAGIEHVLVRLEKLADVKSGKRGSDAARHPLPVTGKNGIKLPKPLLANAPVGYACMLLAWLARLHDEHLEDYLWLLRKWIYASHTRTGEMRLDGKEEEARARSLALDPGIEVKVTPIPVNKSRQHEGMPVRMQMTLGFSEEIYKGKDTGSRPWRAAGAVRWVMTWVVADGVGVPEQ